MTNEFFGSSFKQILATVDAINPSHLRWQGEGEQRPLVWSQPDAPMKGFFPFWKYAQCQQQW